MERSRGITPCGRPAIFVAAALMSVLLSGWRADAADRDVGSRPPGTFDYYVLSLSWVPGFCATHRGQTAECSKGLGFALHGLWPQLNDGDYPTDCDVVALTQSEVRDYRGLYASPSLIAHEWRKHGTCSGLQPPAYFALASSDLRRVRVPAGYGPGSMSRTTDAAAVKSAFIAANPRLSLDGVRTVLQRGRLTEIDICLTKTGNSRAC